MNQIVNSLTSNYWVKASRPRFWLYVLGPALLGLAATGIVSYPPNFGWLTVAMLLWLTWPANIFIYGINDLYDEATDAKNPKKQTREVLLAVARRQRMRAVVTTIGVTSVLIGFFLPLPARLAWFTFLFLGYFYSAPPLRFKTRLLLDAYSNVLYVLPAWVMYGMITQHALPVGWLLIGLFWTAGMHTFSAVPDIAADRAAGELTTAVRLGRHKALWFVTLNWLAAALLTWRLCLFLGVPFGWPGLVLLVYPLLGIANLTDYLGTERSYWWFPWINGLLGFAFFWYLVWI